MTTTELQIRAHAERDYAAGLAARGAANAELRKQFALLGAKARDRITATAEEVEDLKAGNH
jgi:hypothetical protein